LSTWIPAIQGSPAFQQDGLIVITTDESEFSQSGADATECCDEQPGPNSPLPGIVGPGGGNVGTLLLGYQCVLAGGTDDTPYNHYSLLRTLEDIFGITTGGADDAGHLGYAASAPEFGHDVFPCASLPHTG